jgi:hypothetical protein
MLASIQNVRKGKLSKTHSKYMKRAEKWTNKILRMLEKRIILECHTKRCLEGGTAHTVMYLGRSMGVCAKFFSKCKDDLSYQSGVIIHELAHKAGANDDGYFSQCRASKSKSPPTKKNWSKIADTYMYWARDGVCIPGKTCPPR